MPRCCGGATCSCVVQAGPHIKIAGTGSTSDPVVVTGDVGVAVADTASIDLTLSGAGTAVAPWTVSGAFAGTSQLNALGDVTAPAPNNGQVLAWNSSTSQWQPVAPTTAATGSVNHDTSLAGDGSAGNVLQVNEDPVRLLATSASGLGLSDTGMNRVVRHFADDTARTAASPTPTLNALSMLDNNPGQIDYYTGSGWTAAGATTLDIDGNELYEMSGPFVDGVRITLFVRNFTTTTDDNGAFDALPATDLAGRAGVLAASVTPTTGGGVLGTGIPWVGVLTGNSGALSGTAYRLDDGLRSLARSLRCCTDGEGT
jgi:hypothetical protein